MASETVEIRGRLMDTPILAQILNTITDHGAEFEIVEFRVAARRDEESWVHVRVTASDEPKLAALLDQISQRGAAVLDPEDVSTEKVAEDGLVPEQFYCTTRLPTQVRANGHWIDVAGVTVGCAVRVDTARQQALAVPVHHVKKGTRIAVGRTGIRVQQPRLPSGGLAALAGTPLSQEKARAPMIIRIAEEMRAVKRRSGRILLVAGSAVVTTGAGRYVERMIEKQFVDVLFAGAEMAAHDIEFALFGTAMGVYVTEDLPAAYGYQNHMRAINALRVAGGIRPLVERQQVTSGIMRACVTSNVPYVLAGSVCDEAPIPDTLCDVMAARDRMWEASQGVELALMVGTMQLSQAAISLLPAQVTCVCVDVSTYGLNRLSQRAGPSFVGLVASAESFLSELARNLGAW